MAMTIDSITETQAQEILKFLAKKCLMPSFMHNIYMHKFTCSTSYASYANVYFGSQPMDKRFVLMTRGKSLYMYTMKFPNCSHITWKMILDVVMGMGEQYDEHHIPYEICIEDVYTEERHPLNPCHMSLEEILIEMDMEI